MRPNRNLALASSAVDFLIDGINFHITAVFQKLRIEIQNIIVWFNIKFSVCLKKWKIKKNQHLNQPNLPTHLRIHLVNVSTKETVPVHIQWNRNLLSLRNSGNESAQKAISRCVRRWQKSVTKFWGNVINVQTTIQAQNFLPLRLTKKNLCARKWRWKNVWVEKFRQIKV